jgi:hypothetical protein
MREPPRTTLEHSVGVSVTLFFVRDGSMCA